MPAGAVTFTDGSINVGGSEDAVKRYEAAWLSDGSGAASGTLAAVNGTVQIVVVPGSPAPTSYALAITNAEGVNILNLGTTNLGSGLSATVPTIITPVDSAGFPILVSGTLAFAVSGAGSGKVGAIIVNVR